MSRDSAGFGIANEVVCGASGVSGPRESSSLGGTTAASAQPLPLKSLWTNARGASIKARFEWPLIAAAILVIPTVALEQSDVGEPWDTVATVLNWTIWTAFAAELSTMLAVVSDRRRYLRDHPLDLAIVVLTPPFLPSALQAARVFRVLRLVRLVKTAVVLRRLLSAEGVRDAAVLALVVVLGGGAAFAAVEKSQDLSAWDGVWWAVTTVTTVGYGDIGPKTDAGRVIAMTVMLVGIGFVALLTAAAADRFIKTSDGPGVEERLAEMNDPSTGSNAHYASEPRLFSQKTDVEPRSPFSSTGVVAIKPRELRVLRHHGLPDVPTSPTEHQHREAPVTRRRTEARQAQDRVPRPRTAASRGMLLCP